MRRFALFLPLALALAPAAGAQPAPTPKPGSDSDIEKVIVTAPRFNPGITPNAIVHDFIENYAAPAPFLGKYSRWNRRNPICPSAGGFSANNARFIVERVKEVAELVHAPVSYKSNCKPNLAIIVTKDAQGLMTEIRKHRTDLLGYFTSDDRADELATMHFPVQVLYETATIDVRGHVVRDSRGGGTGESSASGDVAGGSAAQDSGDNSPGGSVALIGDYPNFATTGLRLGDGLESAFFNVTIVVDAAKVDSFRLEMGALADYLAMVALAQTENFTPCEQLPSISSLMTPDCATSGLAKAVTTTDIAYLSGLYRMDAGSNPIIERGSIANEVKKSLTEEK